MPISKQSTVPIIAGTAMVLALCGAAIFGTIGAQHQPAPYRVSPAPIVSSKPDTNQTPTEYVIPDVEPTPGAPVIIAGADIINVAVPAIDMDVLVSGKTEPRQTENCHASAVCIDPPVPDQAAWYGDVPSMPSVNPVLLYGHTSWSDPAYAAFNNLLATMAGDRIIVTTESGVFTYVAQAPVFVPYEDVAGSQLIYGWEAEKVVLVTCNAAEDAATVVVGYLESVAPR